MFVKMVKMTLFKIIEIMERNLTHLRLLGQVGIYDQVTGSQGEGNGNPLLYSCLETPGWLSDKEAICNTGDPGLTPGSGRSPGGANGNPLQYSRLDDPMDRRVWRATDHGVPKELDST